MVAVDAQILGGVAVTVLLALLFFGVVVLWDVALALRGVADKIDKLEDTVDDDLTDLERAVNGAPGGSGPQVHLSGGGTITPGSAPQGQQAGHAASRPGAGSGHRAGATNGDTAESTAQRYEDQHPGRDGGRESVQAGETQSNGSTDAKEAASAADSADTVRSDDASTAAVDESQRSRATVGADPTPVRRATAATESGATATDSTDGESDGMGQVDGVNYGRFITSPDRTPWYRTGLDWDAIFDARSPIAGELEAGDSTSSPSSGLDDEADTPDTGGSSDDGSDDDDAAVSEEPIAVDPDGSATTESTRTETDSQSASVAGEPAQADEVNGSAQTADEPTQADRDTTDPARDEAVPDDELGDGDTKDQSATGEGDGSDAEETSPTDEADGSDTEDSSADGDGQPADPTANGSPDADTEGSADTESAADSDATESIVTDADSADIDDSSDDSIVRDPRDDDDESRDGGPVSDKSGVVSDETTDAVSDPASPSTGADAGAEPDDESPAADETPAAFEQSDGMEFTFEEFSPGDSPEPTLTVDDAVEAVNENAPSLSRSTHGVEATAEVDEDGVVLVYDLASSEATDSTTRLLKYQLESFANQSDAAVDVTVSGNRIVVDIPDADGSDVSQWEAAIVEVIDRTLYLSDNSE